MIRHLPRCLALLLAFALAAPAQAQIYRYKDASGNTVVSDKPPPPGTAPAKVYRNGTGADSGNAGAATPAASGSTLADRELEFRKRQQENQERAVKERQAAAEKAEQAENCMRARRQLQMLESGERIATRNEAGEREFMEDGQRSAEIERARKYVAENCR